MQSDAASELTFPLESNLPRAGGSPAPSAPKKVSKTSTQKAPARERLLAKLVGVRHRYGLLRAVTESFSLVVLFAVPLTGVARLDLWGGDHFALGKPADGPTAFFAVAGGIAAFYALTFIVNLFLGRLFCGWGCPVGQLSRFGDDLAVAKRTGKRRLRAVARSSTFATLLGVSILLWWVSPRVMVHGSALAISVTLGALVALLFAMGIHAHFWRWAFCRRVCPIGLYYSVVTAKRTYGIAFHQALATCKDCGLCANVCPVHLDPRHLELPQNEIGGLAADGLPASSHCLRCGDCVRTCEWVFRNEPRERCPLRFGVAELGRPADGSSVPQG